MNYKNSKKVSSRTEPSQEQSIEITYRKSKLTASDGFDYQKLCRSYPGLLNGTFEQIREELKITYDIRGVKAWSNLRREGREFQLASLLDVEKLKETARYYRFPLTPENLYYDIHGRVYARDRDIYGTEYTFAEEDFCKQYKALIGCTLLKKYKFEDYCDGGMDLLKEDSFLNEVAACENAQQIAETLRLEYDRCGEEHRDRYIEVIKNRHYGQKRALIGVGLIAVAALALCGYLGVWERPYQQSVIAANESYLRSDYEATVESMDPVEVERMDVSQKYILAVSCVKCESFNAESQKNILNTISLNGDEKVMEYWIHINRLETEAAEDIALQMSSDQLLYYAYLKEKTVVENDTTLTGEEKSTRLTEIESKLEPLKKEYATLTEE